MDRKIKYAIVAILLVSVVALSSPCFAQDPIRKLGRGVSNLITGPFEVPKSIQEKLYDDGPVAALTYGLFDGIYKMVVRSIVGVYESFTFPMPFPTDYGPIVEPEFLFGPDEPYTFEK